MLYTDADLLTADDLEAVDPEASLVAAAEGVDRAQIVSEAWQDCGDEIVARMDAFGGASLLSTDPASYLNAWGGAMGTSQSRVALSQIVASDAYVAKLSLLQRWVRARALTMFYQAAGRRTTADRYTAKAEDYAAETKRAWLRLATAGLPVVARPLPCPGAVHERGAAGALVASAVSGGSAPSAVSYDVAVTYVDATGVESGPCATVSITVGAAQVLRADITAFAWPASVSLTAGRTLAFRVPATWHVYAGTAGSGLLYRQTSGSGVAIATKTYTLSAAPTTTGAPLGAGQVPDYNLAFQATLQRA